MSWRELVEVDYDEHDEEGDTDLALCFIIDDDRIYIPRSVCEFDGETLEVQEWFAQQEGLI